MDLEGSARPELRSELYEEWRARIWKSDPIYQIPNALTGLAPDPMQRQKKTLVPAWIIESPALLYTHASSSISKLSPIKVRQSVNSSIGGGREGGRREGGRRQGEGREGGRREGKGRYVGGTRYILWCVQYSTQFQSRYVFMWFSHWWLQSVILSNEWVQRFETLLEQFHFHSLHSGVVV